MKRLLALTALAYALSVAGCSNAVSDASKGIGTTNTSSGNGNPAGGSAPPAAIPAGRALFQPLQGVLPYPTDLYFSGTTDGTLNIPANSLSPNTTGLNALDGWSTTAVIRARFGGALDPASLTAASVRVVQVNIDNTTKATVGVVRPLVFGTDFTVGLGGEAGVGNTVVEIKPTKPFVPSTGATNNGYLVVLTNGIKDTAGNAATPDTDYASFVAALPTCAAVTNTTLNGICRLTAANLQIAGALGVSPANVVLTFSFSTQNTRDTMNVIAATATARPIGVQSLGGATTRNLNPQLAGKANVYVGTLQIPYYLSKTAPLTGSWQAAGGPPAPLDATSRFLTRFNPVPAPSQVLAIPVLATVPNATSASGGVKPAAGWPVVIFQHGITRDRTDMLAIADAFADAGFVVVAIDQPLHGITPPTIAAGAANPLYQAANERTFNIDVLNNTTGANGPDGVIDSSGASFINLTSPITSRDNLREAAADLITLAKSVPNLDLNGDGVSDINPARIHFVGHSLGGIVGTVFLGSTPNTVVRTGTLAMPGANIAQLVRESPTFGPRINAGLAGLGLTPGTTLYEQFFRDVQTLVDSGDPANFAAAAAAAHPIHLVQIVGSATSLPDQVIPNNATARLIAAAGLTRILGGSPSNINPAGHRAYVNYVVGNHGSILDPTASLGATVQIQTDTVTFAASDGVSIPITNAAVVQP